MKHEAILLLGPTGSGKTPLGDCLATHGLSGQRCVHFDFGAQLRYAAVHGGDGLGQEDLSFIRDVLRGGALLENDTFHIARTLLMNFLKERHVSANDLVILNGLPRHVGQARDAGEILKIKLVVALECTAETVHERIAGNTGGDRTGRVDDSVENITRKLKIYAAQTHPLIDHYRSIGVPCRTFTVEADTVPEDILAAMKIQ